MLYYTRVVHTLFIFSVLCLTVLPSKVFWTTWQHAKRAVPVTILIATPLVRSSVTGDTAATRSAGFVDPSDKHQTWANLTMCQNQHFHPSSKIARLNSKAWVCAGPHKVHLWSIHKWHHANLTQHWSLPPLTLWNSSFTLISPYCVATFML